MSDNSNLQDGWVSVARLGKTRGLKGEIYGSGELGVQRYAALREVRLRKKDGTLALEGRPFEIESVFEYKGGLVFRFRGLGTIEAVEPLEHSEVVIRTEERPDAPDGGIYLADLIGCDVIGKLGGKRLGSVTGWQEFGGPVLLEVKLDGGLDGRTVLVPFAKSICVEIDLAHKRIVVDLPDGLLELNEGIG